VGSGFSPSKVGLKPDPLAPIEGIKHVVLLSTGFDASLIHGVTPPRQHRARAHQRNARLRSDRIYGAVGHGFSEVGASSSAVTRVGNPSVTVSSRTHEP